MPRNFATDTHCANGHEFTPETSYQPPNGQRKVCRLCVRHAQQKHQGRPLTHTPLAPPNGLKTHCPSGHAYVEHGYAVKGGSRGCKLCHRESRLAQMYGLGWGDYDIMLARQGGACAGCARVLEKKKLHVDHDHACCPGKKSCGKCVRGLLCEDCNRATGILGDNAETLRRLADYLDAA